MAGTVRQVLTSLRAADRAIHIVSVVVSAVPPRCKNPGEFPRCVPPRGPAPKAPRFRARAPVKSPSSRSAFVHAEGTKVASLIRNE